MADGIRWLKVTCAEYIPNGGPDKQGLKWLRNNQASDEVNDKDFQVFLDRLMKHA